MNSQLIRSYPQVHSMLRDFHQDVMIEFDGYWTILSWFLREREPEQIADALTELRSLTEQYPTNEALTYALWDLGAQGLPSKDAFEVVGGIVKFLKSGLQ